MWLGIEQRHGMSGTLDNRGGFLNGVPHGVVPEQRVFQNTFGGTQFPLSGHQRQWTATKVIPDDCKAGSLDVATTVFMYLQKHLAEFDFFQKLFVPFEDDKFSYVTVNRHMDDSGAEHTSLLAPTHDFSTKQEVMFQSVQLYGASNKFYIMFGDSPQAKQEFLEKSNAITMKLVLSLMRDTIATVTQMKRHQYIWKQQTYFRNRDLDFFIEEEPSTWNVVASQKRGINYLINKIDASQRLNLGTSDSILISTETLMYLRMKEENAVYSETGPSTNGFRNKYDVSTKVKDLQGNRVYAVNPFKDSKGNIDDAFQQYKQIGEFLVLSRENRLDDPMQNTTNEWNKKLYSQDTDMEEEIKFVEAIKYAGVFDENGYPRGLDTFINPSGNGRSEDKKLDPTSRVVSSNGMTTVENIDLMGEIRGITPEDIQASAMSFRKTLEGYQEVNEVDKIFSEALKVIRECEKAPFTRAWYNDFIQNNPTSLPVEADTASRSKIIAGDASPPQLKTDDNGFYRLSMQLGGREVMPPGLACFEGLKKFGKLNSGNSHIDSLTRKATRFIDLYEDMTEKLLAAVPMSDYLDKKNTPLAIRDATAANTLFVNATHHNNCFVWLLSGAALQDILQVEVGAKNEAFFDNLRTTAANLTQREKDAVKDLLTPYDYIGREVGDGPERQANISRLMLNEVGLVTEKISARPLHGAAQDDPKAAMMLSIDIFIRLYINIILDAINNVANNKRMTSEDAVKVVSSVMKTKEKYKINVASFLINYKINSSITTDQLSSEFKQVVELIGKTKAEDTVKLAIAEFFDKDAIIDNVGLKLGEENAHSATLAFTNVLSELNDEDQPIKVSTSKGLVMTQLTKHPLSLVDPGMISMGGGDFPLPRGLANYSAKYHPAIVKFFTSFVQALHFDKEQEAQEEIITSFIDQVLNPLKSSAQLWSPTALRQDIESGAINPEWFKKSSRGSSKEALLALVDGLTNTFESDLRDIDKTYKDISDSARRYDEFKESLNIGGGYNVNNYVQTCMTMSQEALKALIEEYETDGTFNETIPPYILCSSPNDENKCGSLEDLRSYVHNQQSLVRILGVDHFKRGCDITDFSLARHIKFDHSGAKENNQPMDVRHVGFAKRSRRRNNTVVRHFDAESEVYMKIGAIDNPVLQNLHRNTSLINGQSMELTVSRALMAAFWHLNNVQSKLRNNISPLFELYIQRPLMRYGGRPLVKIQGMGGTVRTNYGLPTSASTTAGDQMTARVNVKMKGGAVITNMRNGYVEDMIHITGYGGGAGTEFYNPEMMTTKSADSYFNPRAKIFGHNKESLFVSLVPLGFAERKNKYTNVNGYYDIARNAGSRLTESQQKCHNESAFRFCAIWNYPATPGEYESYTSQKESECPVNMECYRTRCLGWDRKKKEYSIVTSAMGHWRDDACMPGSKRYRSGLPSDKRRE